MFNEETINVFASTIKTNNKQTIEDMKRFIQFDVEIMEDETEEEIYLELLSQVNKKAKDNSLLILALETLLEQLKDGDGEKVKIDRVESLIAKINS